jgi:hypothetical protein
MYCQCYSRIHIVYVSNQTMKYNVSNGLKWIKIAYTELSRVDSSHQVLRLKSCMYFVCPSRVLHIRIDYKTTFFFHTLIYGISVDINDDGITICSHQPIWSYPLSVVTELPILRNILSRKWSECSTDCFECLSYLNQLYGHGVLIV